MPAKSGDIFLPPPGAAAPSGPGGLPRWAWAVAIGGGLVVAYLIFRNRAPRTPAPEPGGVPSTTGAPSDGSSGALPPPPEPPASAPPPTIGSEVFDPLVQAVTTQTGVLRDFLAAQTAPATAGQPTSIYLSFGPYGTSTPTSTGPTTDGASTAGGGSGDGGGGGGDGGGGGTTQPPITLPPRFPITPGRPPIITLPPRIEDTAPHHLPTLARHPSGRVEYRGEQAGLAAVAAHAAPVTISGHGGGPARPIYAYRQPGGLRRVQE